MAGKECPLPGPDKALLQLSTRTQHMLLSMRKHPSFNLEMGIPGNG